MEYISQNTKPKKAADNLLLPACACLSCTRRYVQAQCSSLAGKSYI